MVISFSLLFYIASVEKICEKKVLKFFNVFYIQEKQLYSRKNSRSLLDKLTLGKFEGVSFVSGTIPIHLR